MHDSGAESTEFDEALMAAGGFGRFQILLVVVFLATATMHFSCNHMGQVFILLTPEHYGCPSNESFGSSPNSWAKCALKTNEVHNDTVTYCLHGWEFEYGDLYETISTEFQWVCGDAWKQYITHFIFWIGSISGYLTSGFMADRFGRKKTIYFLASVATVANIMPLVAHNDILIIVSRFLAGIGAETVCSTVFLLVMEFTIPEKRTLVGTAWASGWTILGALYPWYARVVFGWKLLLLTTAIISVFIIIICWFVPESASWHLANGRHEKAIAIMNKIAAINKANMKPDVFKKLEITAKKALAAKKNANGKSKFWSDTAALVKTPNMRKITILLFASWFLICLSYNANTLELGHLGLSIYPTYSLSIAFELPVNIFAILFLDKVGRRWPNVIFMLAGGILALFMAVAKTQDETVTMAMAILTIVCYAGGYNITYQLATELFPTVIRGRGVLLERVFGDIGSCLGTQVAFLAEFDKYLPLYVLSILSTLSAICLFFVPETAGLPLPQTLEDGEQFGKGQSLCFCPFLQRKKRPRTKSRSSTVNSYTNGHAVCSIRNELDFSTTQGNGPQNGITAISRVVETSEMTRC